MRTSLSIRVLGLAVLAIVLAHLGDRWAFAHLVKAGIYDQDLGRMFRTVGYLPVWLLLAIALGLQSRNRRAAWLLAGGTTLAGLLCEVLKILLRRERPRLHGGAYYFRPFSDHLMQTRDIGLPSSHAMVAFGAAWVLCRLYPRAWPIWIVLAMGCAITRVLAQAHFLSDTVVAAVTAYFVVAVLWRFWGGGLRDGDRPTLSP